MENHETPLDDQSLDENKPVMQVPVSGATEPPMQLPVSPRWGATTKLVVGLSLVFGSAYLLFRFLNFVGPLLLALLLAYLFYPLAGWLKKTVHLSWRLATTLIYLVLLLLVLSSLGLGGLAVVEQVQSLITFLQGALKDLPDALNNLALHPIVFGPFTFKLNLQLLDINVIAEQILGAVQPILTQAGASVVTVATKVGSMIGWLFFILIISYFMLAESGGIPSRLFHFSIPGYDDDIAQLRRALGRIWNAFLRGQLTIVLITIVYYNILLGGLGVRFFFGLAILAGLARFIPYVGPFIAWTSYGLVAFFQGTTLFGLPPLGYAALVVGSAWLSDVVMDNVVSPRLMSDVLRVHPAAVMVSALVALNLLGVIGMVLAAPVLATVQLLLEYIIAKLFDQNPWLRIEQETIPPNKQAPLIHKIKAWIFQRGGPAVRSEAAPRGEAAASQNEAASKVELPRAK